MLYVVITNLLAVVVVLGVMILIHELGHFLAAKYFGIRVEVFSLGFGKRLWGFQKVRYRGLAKNTTRTYTAFALANLYLMRRRLLPRGAKCAL